MSRWDLRKRSCDRTSCLRAARAELSVRQVLREMGTPYAELGLGDAALTDDDLLDAIQAHPILINRRLS